MGSQDEQQKKLEEKKKVLRDQVAKKN